MSDKMFLTIDNMEVQIEGERNLLEVVRKANIDLPTFCYHSEISIYGACRLCMVEVEGRGLLPACSTLPEAGLVVRTNTEEIRSLRKVIVELLLSSHDNNCPTCPKGSDCQLQSLARRLGINKLRFKTKAPDFPVDNSSPSIVRDPNKCVLCGDCVRVCQEVQGIGALDFAHRGSKSMVTPCFEKGLDSVECVYCGQCARVCPTGALMPKSDIDVVWKQIYNKKKTVVAQIAPAVRVALGESFGLPAGTTSTGQIVAALRAIGFDKVYDTSYAADLTVIEESNEFVKKLESGAKLPHFTSCCPAWVKYAEQYCQDLLPNVSSCRSPQQMFGSIVKQLLPEKIEINKEDLVMVSIMPCTAKKFEAARPEFEKDGSKDVDYVLTTQELVRMIEEAGLDFTKLEPASFDLPFGFKTGAGVIFGNSGGVTEAVLRYAVETVSGIRSEKYEYKAVRGEDGIRTLTVNLNGKDLNFAIVSGLANAKELLRKMKSGEANYDFVEVMACPGGCVGGAGQPVCKTTQIRKNRAKGLYENDKMHQLHKSQENPYITELYENELKSPGSNKAHKLLHTKYSSRRRNADDGVIVLNATKEKVATVTVCFGTGCFIKGSQHVLKSIIDHVKKNNYEDSIDIKTSFCFEKCDRGPVVRINDETFEKCTDEIAIAKIDEYMSNL